MCEQIFEGVKKKAQKKSKAYILEYSFIGGDTDEIALKSDQQESHASL